MKKVILLIVLSFCARMAWASPPLCSPTLQISSPACKDGTLKLKINGVGPGYTYHWLGAAGSGIVDLDNDSTTAIPTVTGTFVYSVNITHSGSAACEGIYTISVTVKDQPASISGTSVVCTGKTTALSNAISSGTWSSSDPGIASVDVTSGVVTGAGPGNATINYSTGCGTDQTIPVTVNDNPEPITGALTVCAGSTTSLHNTLTGGAWTSSDDASIATVDETFGVVTGGATGGTATITYAKAGCTAIATVTVTAIPTTISGPASVCDGSSITLTSTAPNSGGGTWSTSDISYVSLGASSGIVTGLDGGTATIIYSNGCGASVTKDITVYAIPDAITGTLSVCESSTTDLSDDSGTGTWSSSSPANATIDISTGIVTGVTHGTSIITYTQSTGCISASEVTVNPSPAPIGGMQAVCNGLSTAITETTPGGTWTSADISVATLSSSSGSPVTVNGIAAGTSAITYTLPTGCEATDTFTVYALPDLTTSNSFPNKCSGVPLNIDLTSSVTPAAQYTWTSSVVGSLAGNTDNTVPATIITNTIVSSATIPGTVTYTVTPFYTPVAGLTCTNSAAVITATVNPTPKITTSSVSICSETGPNLIVNSDQPSTFAWSAVSPASISGAVSGTTSTSATSTTINDVLTNSSNTTSGVVTYSVTATTSSACSASRTVNVTVNPLPALTKTTFATCAGTSPVITLPDYATIPGTYSWVTDGAHGSTSSSGTATTINDVLTSTGTATVSQVYSVTAVAAVGSCTSTSIPVIVVITPKPSILTSPSLDFCSGTTTSIPLATSLAPNDSVFFWTPTSVSSTVSGAMSGSGTNISNLLSNSNHDAPGYVTYNVTGITKTSIGACQSAPLLVTVNVLPNPSVDPLNLVICSKNRFSHNFSTGGLTSTYTWGPMNPSTPGIYPNATRSSTAFDDSLVNSTDATPQYITYTVVATAGSCSSTMQTFIVTVNPLPTVASSTKTICSRDEINLPLSASVTSNFNWSVGAFTGTCPGNSFGGPASIISGTVISDIHDAAQTIVYTVTPRSTPETCLGSPATITVTVNPEPTMKITRKTICSALPAGILNLGDSVSVTSTFAWSFSTQSGITGAKTGTGLIINDTLTNASRSFVDSIKYLVTPTSLKGCKGTQPGIVTVTVNPIPNTPYITTPVTNNKLFEVCNGRLNENFKVNVSSNDALTNNYQWNAMIHNSSAPEIVVKQNQNRSICSFALSNGGGDTVQIVVSANVTGYATCQSRDTLKVAVRKNSLSNTVDSVYYFKHFLVSKNNKAKSFIWGYDNKTTLDSTIIPNEVNQSYHCPDLDTANRQYWVITTSEEGCTQKSYYNGGDTKHGSRIDNAEAPSLELFPNPVNSELTIRLLNVDSKNTTLDVYDLFGRKVKSIETDNTVVNVSVADLSSGNYIVVCRSNGITVATARLIKN